MCGSRRTVSTLEAAHLLLHASTLLQLHSNCYPICSSMASSIMATQALPVAGLRSSTLHSHPIKKLQGLVNVSKSSRLGFTPIRAAKLPRGVEPPREEPKLSLPFWGFTENAEVWNSRASLIGIVGIIIVEAIINKGLLQVIGVDVGKGLDLPL